MKKLVTISTVGSFAVGVIMMLIELAGLGENMFHLVTFLSAFAASFVTIYATLSLIKEHREQKAKKDEIKYDVGKFKPVHLEILRTLLEEGELVVHNDDYVYLLRNNYVGRIAPEKIVLTKKGKETAMKLEKEGKL